MLENKLNMETGPSKILRKLHGFVGNGEYYEAYKLYKTLYSRYSVQKKYDDLKQLMYDGSSFLLNSDQDATGADLAVLYVTSLVDSKTEPSEEIFIKLAKLFAKMKDTVESREFENKALAWSRNNLEGNKTGHPCLHKYLAQTYWQKNDIFMARHHYLHSSDGCGFAMMLIELHLTKGYTLEIDLFITQVVLQYLCLEKLSIAHDAFECYTSKHPNIIGPPYIWPLLNFICFLLQIIDDSGKLGTFTLLCEQYEPCLKRDPTYVEYLEKIAQIFFHVQPTEPSHHNQQFVDNLISSLMGSIYSTRNDV